MQAVPDEEEIKKCIKKDTQPITHLKAYLGLFVCVLGCILV